MKKLNFLLLIIFPCLLHAQIGIKAGLNFANVTNASSINSKSQSGFMAGIFFAPPSKKIISYKTELIFSQQGYSYETNTTTGKVNLDYIIMPHLVNINITKLFQLQIGGQVAYLINAKADSSQSSSPNNPYGPLTSYYNRFDYGAAAGIEIHPILGLLIGARYNISFGDLYKNYTSSMPGTVPSFIPNVNAKNNVIQIFAGWQFGGNSKKKKTS